MIRFHREGFAIIRNSGIIFAILALASYFLVRAELWRYLLIGTWLTLYLLILQFFRNPARKTPVAHHQVIAPADGKIVMIKEIEEKEYFKDKRLQISIFMSPLNVHVNRYPISGVVKYVAYHPGAYLVAWHPKSSLLNERTSVVIESPHGQGIMYKQIAGAVARRLVYYAQEGQRVLQGQDSGFIKFGSRVDVILPLEANILVKEGDKARGGTQVLAELK